MSRSHHPLRQYLRRPDRAFWLDLFKPVPPATEAANLRRARVTRYALGGSLMFTLPYAVISLLLDPDHTLPAVLVNAGSALAFTIGLWMASLEKNHLARALLMVTLNVQLAALVWLTGSTLSVVSFSLAAAALARVLYTVEEHKQQVFFIGVPAITITYTLAFEPASIMDFSQLPVWIPFAMRILNTLLSLTIVILILGVFEREVLRNEEELVRARDSSDRLLHAVLPRRIAEELRSSDRAIANHHPEVTVLFADIAGFTPWSAQQDPETVVAMLEKVFSRFDALVAHSGVEKIKTIGDAYMVISGAPEPRDDHVHVILTLALAMLEDVRMFREETGIPLNLRVGVHTGPVIAGVIGALRFTYDVWGDTVNTASRMESHGEPGRIQVSDETRRRAGDDFHFEPRGMVTVKGKGEMETWWLTG